MKAVLAIIFLICLLFLTAFPKHKARVVIIDTGLDVEDPRFKDIICGYQDFTGNGIQDNIGHGTHIAGLIKKYAKNKNYCLIILKYYNNDLDSREKINNSLTQLYNALYNYTPDVVNFSGGGEFLEVESLVIKDLSTTKFFAAAGNNNENIDKSPFYPASLNYPNVIPVGALAGFLKAPYSNWGKRVIWEQGDNILSTVPYSIYPSGYMYMSGTSMACAAATGKFIYDHY